MELTLKELLEGRATIIKNKEYFATRDYVNPFLDIMSSYTDDFRVSVKVADQLAINQDEQTIYNRVLVQAVLPEKYCIDSHDEVVGLLYGLDVRKPISKVYRGYLNRACTNLCVFNPQWMTVQEMKPNEQITYDIKGLMEMASDLKLRLDNMKQKFISKEEVHNQLGSWIDGTLRDSYYNGIHNVKISPATAVEAYSSLYIDEKSEYFIPDTEEASYFNVYNAFTQVITDDKKDIMNKFEKTLLINRILGV